MTEPGKLWVGSIVIDCRNFERMVDFWKAALGYQLRRPPSEDWALLFDPHGKGPNIAFQKDPEGPGNPIGSTLTSTLPNPRARSSDSYSWGPP